MNTVFKAGSQSEKDPYEFIMSTDDVDRVGDIVDQDWNLKSFKKNPIALWAHDSSLPIGVWENVRVEANALMGRLKMATRGTSELIDTLHSLIEQRIIRAVSVGFRPHKAEPIDPEDPWGGYRLSENELLECSLVSVPANPFALSLAKGLSPRQQDMLFREPVEPFNILAVAQLNILDPVSLGSKSAASGVNNPAVIRAKAAILAANKVLRAKR